MANTDVFSYVVAFNVHEDGETEKTYRKLKNRITLTQVFLLLNRASLNSIDLQIPVISSSDNDTSK